MDETQLERERKHRRTKLILRCVGLVSLAAGLTFVIIAFIDFFSVFGNAMSNDASPDGPKKFWMFFVGFPLLAVGLALTFFSFQRNIAMYVKNESVPVLNELGQDIRPGIGAIASAIKSTDAPVCGGCGAKNEADAIYCKGCALPLKKVCAGCETVNAADAKFCKNCAGKL